MKRQDGVLIFKVYLRNLISYQETLWLEQEWLLIQDLSLLITERKWKSHGLNNYQIWKSKNLMILEWLLILENQLKSKLGILLDYQRMIPVLKTESLLINLEDGHWWLILKTKLINISKIWEKINQKVLNKLKHLIKIWWEL